MDDYVAYLKRRMMVARLMGILACLVAIAGILLKYFNLINEWLCIISIAYAMGTIFASNSNLQDIRVGNPWQGVNALAAALLYVFVIFLIAYGFAEGLITTQF